MLHTYLGQNIVIECISRARITECTKCVNIHTLDNFCSHIWVTSTNAMLIHSKSDYVHVDPCLVR